ncbi:MAG: molybdopterin-binding protein [Eubacteriales bacterium]|nr:molybdopterin-binding protein [Eubacteriales bacterium]
MNEYTAAVITVSDKGAAGLREDGSGPALCTLLQNNGWTVVHTAIVPDELDDIKQELTACADERGVCLVLTTGGTGFAMRDVTPEATKAVLEREAPGIAEAMRAESMKITNRGMLSRGVSGIRKETLIVNLPGSPKAAVECLVAVIGGIRHGIQMLKGWSGECAAPQVTAVCVSTKKGEQKHEVDTVTLLPDWGIEGDAHAGNWHRQVSLLGEESVKKLQDKLTIKLEHGAFAENILTRGICLYELPVGTKLTIGDALVEVTQIGKECHRDCAIRKAAGDCVMPREGIFVKVLKGATVKSGDLITVEK